MNHQPITHDQMGVSLIESLVIVVMVAVMVFLMANIPNAMNLLSKAKHTSLAREIAAKQIEDKRSISYVNLANDSAAISDSRMGLLPEGSGTIVTADCDEQVCTNDENVKQITVTIFWKDNNKDQKVTLTTLIGEGGLNQ